MAAAILQPASTVVFFLITNHIDGVVSKTRTSPWTPCEASWRGRSCLGTSLRCSWATGQTELRPSPGRWHGPASSSPRRWDPPAGWLLSEEPSHGPPESLQTVHTHTHTLNHKHHHFMCDCVKCVCVSYLVVKLRTGRQPVSRPTAKAWAQCRSVWVWSRGSCNHLGTEHTW